MSVTKCTVQPPHPSKIGMLVGQRLPHELPRRQDLALGHRGAPLLRRLTRSSTDESRGPRWPTSPPTPDFPQTPRYTTSSAMTSSRAQRQVARENGRATAARDRRHGAAVGARRPRGIPRNAATRATPVASQRTPGVDRSTLADAGRRGERIPRDGAAPDWRFCLNGARVGRGLGAAACRAMRATRSFTAERRVSTEAPRRPMARFEVTRRCSSWTA
jgi:hypothetical protein